jgi:hypothetical protein
VEEEFVIERGWLRHEGRVIRFLWIEDYRPCRQGEADRQFVKRITHRRWSLGRRSEQLTAHREWFAALPADTWCEVGA